MSDLKLARIARRPPKSKYEKWLREHSRSIPLYILLITLFTLYFGGMISLVISNGLSGILSEVPSKKASVLNPLACISASFSFFPIGIILLLFFYAAAAYEVLKRHIHEARIGTLYDERGIAHNSSNTAGDNEIQKPVEVRQCVEVEPLKRTKGIILGKYAPEGDPLSTEAVVSLSPDGKRYKRTPDGSRVICRHDSSTNEKIYPRESFPIKSIGNNRHTVCIAPSGSGKSYTFVLSNIFQSIEQGSSFEVVDPKGELYSITSEYARERGYTVKILNLAVPTRSDSLDILSYVKNSGDAMTYEAIRFCELLIANTEDLGGKGNAGITAASKELLTALVLYVLEAPECIDCRCIGFVKLLLRESDLQLDARFKGLPVSSAAVSKWSAYRGSSDNFRGNIRSDLSSRLSVLDAELIRNILDIDDIDITLPGKEKCAYYIVMEDMSSTFKFVSALFFTCSFYSLVAYSRQQDDLRLPQTVNFFLDEFTAIGSLSEFDKKLATVRSAGINISMIFQSLAHLKVIYPNGIWETLLANAGAIVCIGCNDATTADYLSKRCGTMTVQNISTRETVPVVQLLHVPAELSYSYSSSRRETMTVGDIQTLGGKGKVLVLVSGQNLFLCDPFPYTDIVDDSLLKKVNMNSHIPRWVEEREAEAAALKKKAEKLRDIEEKRTLDTPTTAHAKEYVPAFQNSVAHTDSTPSDNKPADSVARDPDLPILRAF